MAILDRLSREFLGVVEDAAVAWARTMGQGDRKNSDRVAVEAMRKSMDSLSMRGTVVIGEGERDEAPMLYIGERVGRGSDADPEPRATIASGPAMRRGIPRGGENCCHFSDIR